MNLDPKVPQLLCLDPSLELLTHPLSSSIPWPKTPPLSLSSLLFIYYTRAADPVPIVTGLFLQSTAGLMRSSRQRSLY